MHKVPFEELSQRSRALYGIGQNFRYEKKVFGNQDATARDTAERVPVLRCHVAFIEKREVEWLLKPAVFWLNPTEERSKISEKFVKEWYEEEGLRQPNTRFNKAILVLGGQAHTMTVELVSSKFVEPSLEKNQDPTRDVQGVIGANILNEWCEEWDLATGRMSWSGPGWPHRDYIESGQRRRDGSRLTCERIISTAFWMAPSTMWYTQWAIRKKYVLMTDKEFEQHKKKQEAITATAK